MIDQDRAGGSHDAATTAAGQRCGSWLWCSPPALPADTSVKVLVDRLLPRSGWPAALYFGTVAGLWSAYSQISERPGPLLAGFASLAGGAWCSVNFWRCRHAHCLVTGAGWLALTGLIGVELLIGRSLIAGAEGLAFLAILVAGVLFEIVWYRARGDHAVGRTHPAR